MRDPRRKLQVGGGCPTISGTPFLKSQPYLDSMHTPNPQMRMRERERARERERESGNRQALSEEGVGRTGKEESRGKGASRGREN